ncbi:hypothetical protein [Sorangium cellulosum]|nr:hypothetical protein [Sorangium cellulosum]
MRHVDSMMETRAYLALPIAAGLVFAASAALLKREKLGPAGVMLVTLLTNLGTAVGLSLFYGTFPVPRSIDGLVAPLVAGSLFYAGQALTFEAVSRGDVSIAGPLLSTKVIFVPIVAAIIAVEAPTVSTLIAAVAGLMGGVMLQLGPKSSPKRLRATVLLSLAAVFSFSIFDVVVQRFGQQNGAREFVPRAMIFATICSAVGMKLSRSARAAPLPSSRPLKALAFVAALMAIQAMLVVGTIAEYGDAAGVNVAYGTRGIWSIAVIAVFGKSLGISEFEGGRRQIILRLVAATFILLALVVTLVRA